MTGLLAEHVIDRDGLVWRVVRDGGMATRAHYAGIVSIGISTLEREHGPLTTVAALVAQARREGAEEALREAAREAISEHPPGPDGLDDPSDRFSPSQICLWLSRRADVIARAGETP